MRPSIQFDPRSLFVGLYVNTVHREFNLCLLWLVVNIPFFKFRSPVSTQQEEF